MFVTFMVCKEAVNTNTQTRKIMLVNCKIFEVFIKKNSNSFIVDPQKLKLVVYF